MGWRLAVCTKCYSSFDNNLALRVQNDTVVDSHGILLSVGGVGSQQMRW